MKLAWSRLAVAALVLMPCAAPAQNLSNEITVRRHALRTDLAGLLSVAPEPSALVLPEADQRRLGADGLAQLKAAYGQKRDEAVAMKRKTDQAIRADALEALEGRFPALKSELMSLLFSATSSHYFDDKDRFLQQKQAELDIRAAAQKRAAAARTSARVSKLQAQLGSVPDRATLDKLYDSLSARTVVSESVAVSQGRRTGAAALAGVAVMEFKPAARVRLTAPEPPSPWAGDGAGSYAPAPRTTLVSAVMSQGASSSIAQYVLSWSDRLGVSPFLVAATCARESTCQQTRADGRTVMSTYVNKKTGEVGHAYGVMQIISTTASGLARQLGTSAEAVKHDASTNIHAGILYLKQRLAAYGADFDGLTAKFSAFAQSVASRFSARDLDRAEHDLSHGRRSAAIPLVNDVVQESFRAGLGSTVFALGSYNGQRRPDQTAYSSWNRQSHDYVFYILKNIVDMFRTAQRGAVTKVAGTPVAPQTNG